MCHFFLKPWCVLRTLARPSESARGYNLYDKSTREPLVVLRCSDTRPNGVPVPHELQVGRSTHGSGYITPIASSGMGIWSNHLWIGVSLIIFITWRIVAASLAGCWWRLILPNPKKTQLMLGAYLSHVRFPKIRHKVDHLVPPFETSKFWEFTPAAVINLPWHIPPGKYMAHLPLVLVNIIAPTTQPFLELRQLLSLPVYVKRMIFQQDVWQRSFRLGVYINVPLLIFPKQLTYVQTYSQYKYTYNVYTTIRYIYIRIYNAIYIYMGIDKDMYMICVCIYCIYTYICTYIYIQTI